MNRNIASILVLLLLTGCQGYKIEKGRWSFVQWNEGRGRMVLPVDNADQESFKPINRDYAKDSKRVYLWNRVIEGADPNTFIYLGNDYGKDGAKVFLRGKELQGADPNSFQVLESGWSKDRYDVYAPSRALKVEDMASFKVLHVGLLNYWAKDKNAYYFAGHSGRIDCDYLTMIILSDLYGVDKNRAYYSGLPIEGVDVKTFRVTGTVTAKDKYQKYRGGSVDWVK